MGILTEINEFQYTIEELNENGMPKKFRLKGIYQKADTPNGNKRVYPRAVLESAVKSVQENVTAGRMLGELDHPADAKIHLDKVSHVITNLEMQPSGEVYGEAEVLETPAGRILESLLKSKVKLGISSRGFGSTKEKDGGLQEVQNDYHLVTFDIVADPSTPGAYPEAVYEENAEQNKETEVVSEEDAVISLDASVDEILEEEVTIEREEKEFLCSDEERNRFYMVKEEYESYGNLKFHASHEYHVLIKNEDFQEKISLNKDNLESIESLYGEKVYNKICSKLEELNYNSKTLTLKKED